MRGVLVYSEVTYTAWRTIQLRRLTTSRTTAAATHQQLTFTDSQRCPNIHHPPSWRGTVPMTLGRPVDPTRASPRIDKSPLQQPAHLRPSPPRSISAPSSFTTCPLLISEIRRSFPLCVDLPPSVSFFLRLHPPPAIGLLVSLSCSPLRLHLLRYSRPLKKLHTPFPTLLMTPLISTLFCVRPLT